MFVREAYNSQKTSFKNSLSEFYKMFKEVIAVLQGDSQEMEQFRLTFGLKQCDSNNC